MHLAEERVNLPEPGVQLAVKNGGGEVESHRIL
jgi:hypothetical protein